MNIGKIIILVCVLTLIGFGALFAFSYYLGSDTYITNTSSGLVLSPCETDPVLCGSQEPSQTDQDNQPINIFENTGNLDQPYVLYHENTHVDGSVKQITVMSNGLMTMLIESPIVPDTIDATIELDQDTVQNIYDQIITSVDSPKLNPVPDNQRISLYNTDYRRAVEYTDSNETIDQLIDYVMTLVPNPLDPITF